MNIHSSAKTCPASRALLVSRVLEQGWPVKEAAFSAGISLRRAYVWLARYRKKGPQGHLGRSSQPHRMPRSHAIGIVVEAIGRRRQGQMGIRIAADLGLPKSTVGAWLRKAGISRQSDLRPKEPANRFEHANPGDLLHLDTKKLPSFKEVGHRAYGIQHNGNVGCGYQVLHVCSDGHSRTAYMERLPDEKTETTAGFSLVLFHGFVDPVTRSAVRGVIGRHPTTDKPTFAHHTANLLLLHGIPWLLVTSASYTFIAAALVIALRPK